MRIDIVDRSGDRVRVRFLGAAGAVVVDGPDGPHTVPAHETLTVTAGRAGNRLKAVDALGRVAYKTIPAGRPEAAPPKRKTTPKAAEDAPASSADGAAGGDSDAR